MCLPVPTARGLYAGNLRGSYRNTLTVHRSACPFVHLSVRDQNQVEIIIARQKLAERLWKRPGPQNITRFESSWFERLGVPALVKVSSEWTTDNGRRTSMSVILTASERTMQTTFHFRREQQQSFGHLDKHLPWHGYISLQYKKITKMIS